MLIVALVLAVIGLAALVTSVVTGNEMIAWVCIGASGLGVLLLVFDAIRDRTRRRPVLPVTTAAETTAVIAPVHAEPAYVDDGEIYADYADYEDAEEAEDEDVLDDEDALEGEDVDDETVVEDEIDYPAEESREILDYDEIAEDHPDEIAEDHPDEIAEDHPDEIVHDEPEYDTFSDDEPELPEPAEEAAVHAVSEEYLAAAEAAEEAAAEAAPEVEVLSAEAFVTEVRYSGEPVNESVPEPATFTHVEAETPAYTHVEADETPGFTYVEAEEVRSYTYVEADVSDEDKK